MDRRERTERPAFGAAIVLAPLAAQELNYGVQIAPWLLIRPALRYVLRPGGYGTRPDTFVFSMHIQAAL